MIKLLDNKTIVIDGYNLINKHSCLSLERLYKELQEIGSIFLSFSGEIYLILDDDSCYYKLPFGADLESISKFKNKLDHGKYILKPTSKSCFETMRVKLSNLLG